MNVVLISTYEMGRQPFGLASPAAWLADAGATVRCVDLSIEMLPEDTVQAANLVAFYIPMHTATRMAVQQLPYVRALNPTTHICFYGLYASENADYLRGLGVDTVIGGEFETGLVALYHSLNSRESHAQDQGDDCHVERSETSRPTGQDSSPAAQSDSQNVFSLPYPHPIVSLDRQSFKIPDRSQLPTLDRYAHLVLPGGEERVVGYVEATRGCKHLCRHCPIVPVYGGHFRIVQREVVLADIRQQVAAGAQHITFGDPDFFNGPGHALPIIRALHAEFPQLTYDVTIKIEHLLKYAEHIPTLKATNCLLVVSAVEAFDEHILTIFDKHHTQAEFEQALGLCNAAGLLLMPTFVAFTPWTTLEGYRAFLAEIARLGLADRVPPIQYAIRLLIPPGSRLLELPETQAVIEGLNQARLTYTWRHPDPRMDQLQRDLELLVQAPGTARLSRRDFFRLVWRLAHQVKETLIPPAPSPTRGEGGPEVVLTSPSLILGEGGRGVRVKLPSPPPFPPDTLPVPYMSEPWYC